MSDSETNLSDTPERGPMDQFSAHLDRGWDLIHRGDFTGAQLSAEKSLELDAYSPEAHNLLGYVRAAQGDAVDALEHYKQAIALDDSFLEAMLNAAEVLIHPIHDFDGAMGMVDEALSLAEGDDEVADAMLLKFDAHMHQGDPEGAKHVADALPAGIFESPRIDFLVGRAHFEVENFEAALPLLVSATERDESNSDAHYYLGLVHESLGDSHASTLAFLRSRDLDLQSAPVSWTLPQAHFEKKVRAAIESLPEPLAKVMDGALVVIGDVPGIEIVADGVDPRAGLVLDATGKEEGGPNVGRLFVYQRNIERVCEDVLQIEQDLTRIMTTELASAFEELAAYLPAPEPEDQGEPN